MRSFLTSCFLLLSSCFFTFAQTFVDGQLLVQIKLGNNVEAVIRDLQFFDGVPTHLYVKKFVSPPMNIWLLEYEYDRIDQQRFLNTVKFHPAVSEAQLNHHIFYRSTVPNDPQFNQQWQYINTGQGGGTVGADIDADLAWDITTGGLTAYGDTIVVCVVDDGLSASHPDFAGNMWFNYDEIPNNNIDDDGNGYEDDYRGWNADDDDDDISGGTWGGGHGTAVAGIVGAKGNNGVGVTGVNWNVKLMIVVGGGNEAQAVEAYTYPLVMRKRYNQSGGTQGAFVVATNSSWGIDGGQPAQSPLWCAMYDTLGAYGILSAGATINGNQNVDVFGDLPTACPSDWLISVTNTNKNDNKVIQAGYGLTTIDLGAPGEDAYTANYPNNYAGFGGTSGATPHVAGTIGLLYSVQCASFMALAQADPAAAALQVKQYIMNGVDANSSLNGITVTGGRLNVFGAVTELLNNCSAGGCVTPFSRSVNSVLDTSANFVWNGAGGTDGYDLRYKPIASGTWTIVAGVTSPLAVTGLAACTEYEFQVMALCSTDSSVWSQSVVFTTDGCCEPTTGLAVTAITDSSATLSWNSLIAANAYNVEVHFVGSNIPISFQGLTDTSVNVIGLEPCKLYEFWVQTVCDTGLTGFSQPFTFKTKGCGACIDMTYCDSKGADASDEWIKTVTLGLINNVTASDGGYGDYTNLSTMLEQTQVYSISVTPGFNGGQTFNEVFRVWIDYNQNGNFNDSGELVYSSGSTNTTVTGNFTVPQTATLGSTRMRVSMKFSSPASQCQNPFTYGEVEDYCVEIVENDTINSINDAEAQLDVTVFPNPFANEAVMQFSNPEDRAFQLLLLDVQGRVVRHYTNITGERTTIHKGNLQSGIYLFELRDSKGKAAARGKLIVE